MDSRESLKGGAFVDVPEESRVEVSRVDWSNVVFRSSPERQNRILKVKIASRSLFRRVGGVPGSHSESQNRIRMVKAHPEGRSGG